MSSSTNAITRPPSPRTRRWREHPTVARPLVAGRKVRLREPVAHDHSDPVRFHDAAASAESTGLCQRLDLTNGELHQAVVLRPETLCGGGLRPLEDVQVTLRNGDHEIGNQ